MERHERSLLSDGKGFYIPHREVLPAYQSQGIGSEFVRRMVENLRRLHTIDLLCDPALRALYERIGMKPAVGMVVRNDDRQSGEHYATG